MRAATKALRPPRHKGSRTHRAGTPPLPLLTLPRSAPPLPRSDAPLRAAPTQLRSALPLHHPPHRGTYPLAWRQGKRSVDCALLIRAVQTPPNEEGALPWGLRFVARGDVLLEDGSVVTLDQLAQDIEVDPPPYLEEPFPTVPTIDDEDPWKE